LINKPQLIKNGGKKMNKKYERFDLRIEYKNFVGDKPIVIISNLLLSQLIAQYTKLNASEFQLYTSAEWNEIKKVFTASWSNDMKHKMRDIRHADMNGYQEGDTEQMFRNVETPNVVDEVISKLDKERLLSALNCLNENQKRRIIL
jgi:hypothetical protein